VTIEEFMKAHPAVGKLWGPITQTEQAGEDGQTVTVRYARCDGGGLEERTWTQDGKPWTETWGWAHADFPPPR
jgi:hypothetical protein